MGKRSLKTPIVCKYYVNKYYVTTVYLNKISFKIFEKVTEKGLVNSLKGYVTHHFHLGRKFFLK